MVPHQARDHLSIEELRRLLIPALDAERWDDGELAHALLHLDDQAALARCDVLLGLAVVQRRSLEPTGAARAVALREVLVELLPKELDHPCCCALRALAGLAQGTAGRRREQRQEAAGRALGPDRHPVTPRAVRNRVKRDCWPWLLDRLIEQEVGARKMLEADERGRPWITRGWSIAAGGDPPDAHAELPPAMSGPLIVALVSSHQPVGPIVAGWPAALGPMLWWSLAGLGEEPGLAWLPPALPPSSNEVTLDDDMKRRMFLGIPAAWLASRSGVSKSFGTRMEGATVVDTTTLDGLAAAVASDKRLCNQLGCGRVQGLVVEHAGLATDLLRSSPAALRPRLAAVASEAAAQAGFVCHDQRQLPAARSYYRLAAELAHEAGDPVLEAFVLGNWGDRLVETGEAGGALPILEHAGTLAGSRSSPATVAHLGLVEAQTDAMLGHADASRRALDRVDSALDREDRSEDPPFLYWLHESAIAGWKGECLTLLGRLEDADVSLANALSAWPASFVRDRALTLVHLANLRLRQQEIEECCRVALEALDVAVATSSPRVVQLVRELRTELQPWSESSGVKALDEQMVAASWV